MPEPRDRINYAKARMTSFYALTRYFVRPRPDPALNYVIVGDSGAGASKAESMKDSKKS